MSQLQLLIDQYDPDIILLQETKVINEDFPIKEICQINPKHHIVFSGMKSYNGVAIITKYQIQNVQYGFQSIYDKLFTNTQILENKARYIICSLQWTNTKTLHANNTINTIQTHCAYVPNGREVGSEFFDYKMHFLHCMRQEMQARLAQESIASPITSDHYEHISIVAGDFNIAPTDNDIYKEWPHELLKSPAERNMFKSFVNHDMKEASSISRHNIYDKDHKLYSWWDYRNGCFDKNLGAKIDHILISDYVTVQKYQILRELRAMETPSDHAPVLCELLS